MKNFQRAISVLSILMGGWVIASFVGVIATTGQIEFWTTSLKWSILVVLVVMPVLVFFHYANGRAKEENVQREQQPVLDEQPDFIDEEDRKERGWVSDDPTSAERK